MFYSRKMRTLAVTMPKRFSEVIALVSVSTTVFLFFHTQMLTARISEIQGVLTAASSSSARDDHENQLGTGNNNDHLLKSQNGDLNQNDKIDDSTIQVRGLASFTLPNKFYNATALNNTRKAVRETLFFNRVPKVGSQLTMDLIHRLSEHNNFHFHRDATQKVETIRLTYYEESRLTTMVDMLTPPSSYVKHTCFTNFTRHGYPMPIYINMVRDPIERVISWFYYIRAPWYIVERRQAFPELPLPHPLWLKKDFETCVLSGDRECQFIPGEFHDGVGDHRRQNMFFCGHVDNCLEFNGEWAMQQAKRNVEENYAVVGVLEEMDLTLNVLENYIPRFFSGATKIYYDNFAVMKKINRNNFKPPVTEHVKNILRQNFTREVEFYEFCKQRLHMQYVALLQQQQPLQIN